MAQLEISNRNKTSTHRNTRVDLTPMVDLGFLLITFFIFTTTMSEPTAMKLTIPDASDTGSVVSKELVLTVLPVANDVAGVYEGDIKDRPLLQKTDLTIPSSLRDYIIQKQKSIRQKNKDSRELVVIIKPGEKSSYKNLIDILDEMQINGVKKYAVVKQSEEDKQLLAGAGM
ncbi:MAG: ExbD/TolR family protein [Sphingobacteriales bacterium]